MFKAISKEQAESVAYIAADAGRIKRRAMVLIGKLDELYGYEFIQSETGVAFKTGEGDVLGWIESPFGAGQLSYSLGVVGSELEGRVLVEKSIRIADGSNEWLPVWVIRITEKGEIIPSDEDVSPLDTSTYSGSVSEDIRLLGLSILYALAKAPSWKEPV